jgi:CubicO group peptidase (beta-lactamase class C family)
LQAEGKLNVKDKLSKYIPDFPRGDEVTLRQLLTHTSGIHDYLQESDILTRATNATTTEAIIGEIKKTPYDFDPGTKWSYDNSGYRLLGYIVEKVSGQSYGNFLHENFFRSLGMTNTGVYPAHLALPREALGYSQGTNGFDRALWDSSGSGGDGALYSTVEDLYRWNEGVFNGRVLDAASLKAAFTPVKTRENQTSYNSKGDGYGFGWFVGHDRGLRYISHGGGLPGFSSMLVRLPSEKFTVAILANAMPSKPGTEPQALAHQLVDIFLADKLAPLPIVNTNVSPKSYDALAGRYEIMGAILSISREDTHLFIQLGDQPEAELFPTSDTEFFCKVVDASCTFVKDKGGKAVKLIFDYDSMKFVCPRAKDE